MPNEILVGLCITTADLRRVKKPLKRESVKKATYRNSHRGNEPSTPRN